MRTVIRNRRSKIFKYGLLVTILFVICLCYLYSLYFPVVIIRKSSIIKGSDSSIQRYGNSASHSDSIYISFTKGYVNDTLKSNDLLCYKNVLTTHSVLDLAADCIVKNRNKPIVFSINGQSIELDVTETYYKQIVVEKMGGFYFIGYHGFYYRFD